MRKGRLVSIAAVRESLRAGVRGRTLSPVVAPAAILLGVFGVWSARDGGYATTVWLPSAIVLLALLALVVALLPPPPRLLVVAIGLLGAFTAFNYLSIAWAGSPGDAWDGANRTLLYLTLFAVVAWLPWTPRIAGLAVGGFSLIVAVLGLVKFLQAASSASATADAFIGHRLADPITYSNATAALFLCSAFAALVLAAPREATPVARGLLLAAAGASTELSILSQSRGSLVAVPLALLAVLAFAPFRLRILLVVGAVAVPVALSSPRLLDVYRTGTYGSPYPALPAARTAVIASIVALFGFGLLLGVLDRRVNVPRRVSRGIGVAIVSCALLSVVAGVVVAARKVPHPIARVDRAWIDFKDNKKVVDSRLHLAQGVGSNRYDIWRVALLEFRAHPVAGVGSDNFAAGYLRLRRTYDEPQYPHSVVLRVPQETGIVGSVLFFGFLGASVFVAVRNLRRRTETVAAAVGAAALALFTYWFVHGTIDWFWEIPALGGPALAWLALAAALAPRTAGGRAAPTRPASRGKTVAISAGALLVSVSLVLPWIAARDIARAEASWQVSPKAAYAQLRVARRLNPLTDEADTTEGVIAMRLGQQARARTAFTRALGRDPSNWYALLELAVLDESSGNHRSAAARIAAARRLDPREPALADVQRRLQTGRPVTQKVIEDLLVPRFRILTAGR